MNIVLYYVLVWRSTWFKYLQVNYINVLYDLTCVLRASTNTIATGTPCRSLLQVIASNTGRGINARAGIQELNWTCTGFVPTRRLLDNV